MIGAALFAGARRAPSAERVVLAVTAAAAYASIDLTHGLPGRIRPIYVADGVAQLLLIALVLAFRRFRGAQESALR